MLEVGDTEVNETWYPHYELQSSKETEKQTNNSDTVWSQIRWKHALHTYECIEQDVKPLFGEARHFGVHL